MPGPMTNDWWRIGAESNDVEYEETTGSAEANEALVLNNASAGFGGAKVATKVRTTKASLPGWEDATSEQECNGRLDPTPEEMTCAGLKHGCARAQKDSKFAVECWTLSSEKKSLNVGMNNWRLFGCKGSFQHLDHGREKIQCKLGRAQDRGWFWRERVLGCTAWIRLRSQTRRRARGIRSNKGYIHAVTSAARRAV